MTTKQSAITQKEAKSFLKAAREAGFGSATIIRHPDGRHEYKATIADTYVTDQANSWDDLVK